MANRYWVGGTGSWSDASNHWASSSGGSGAGGNLPTITDDVYFDAQSFDASGTITLDISANCKNFDWTGLDNSVWFSSAVQSAYIYGDVSLNNNLQWVFTGTGYVYLLGNDVSVYISSNNCIANINRIYIQGLNNTYNHLDGFSIIGSMYWRHGIWNTNNNDVSISNILAYDNTLPNLYDATYRWVWGNNTISCMRFDNNPGKQIDISTSTLICTNGWIRPKVNLYKVIIQNATDIYDSNVMDDVTLNYTRDTLTSFWQPPSTTINKLTINCNNNVVLLGFGNHYSTYTTKNLVINDISINNANRLSFRDISIGGNANLDLSNLPGYSENCGGTSGIIFTPSVSCYYVHNSGSCAWMDASKWVTTSGGILYSRIPLAQDNAIFDENSFVGISTLSWDIARIGDLNMSNVTYPVTLSLTNHKECYGNYVLGENITPIGNYSVYLRGDTDRIINTYGKSMYRLHNYNKTLTLMSDINLTNTFYNDWFGNVDFNDYNVSCFAMYGKLSVHGGIFYLRNSTIILNGTTGDLFYCPNYVYPGTSTIIVNPISGNSTVNFKNNVYANASFNKLIFGGNHTGYISTDVYSLYAVRELQINSGRKVKFAGGQTQKIGKFIASGTSDASIYIGSTTSSPFTLNASAGYTRMQVEHCFIQDSTVSPNNRWYAQNSTDLGGNSGWNFKEYSLKPLMIGNKIINKHIEK